MSAGALLAELRRHGVELRPEGDRLLYRPKDALPPALRDALRQQREEVLALLRPDGPGLDLLDEGPVLDVRQEPVAWLFYSRLLGREFWLAVDERTADRLAGKHSGVPIVTFAEVPRLEGKPPELLRAILETKATFPDARASHEG